MVGPGAIIPIPTIIVRLIVSLLTCRPPPQDGMSMMAFAECFPPREDSIRGERSRRRSQ